MSLQENSATVESVEDIYELTPLQQVMLFSTLYAPDSGVYFETVSIPLRGPVSVPLLSNAWRRVVERHQVLRTSFHWEDLEKPVQVVHRHADLPVVERDWRGMAEDQQLRELESFLAEDRVRGFTLDEAPLMRLAFIQLAEGAWQFVWSFHHILLDGWSVQLVLKDVFEWYQALSRGRELQLPAVRPYGDYIGWIQLQDPAEEGCYWRRALKGIVAPTRFNVDEVVPTASADQGQYVEQRMLLSAKGTASLQTLAKAHRITLNTIVQGAWAILLSRYSGNEDIVFGAVSSGRPPDLAHVESMVGMFINTLPVRVQVPGSTQLIPWLKNLQAQQTESRRFEYSHPIQVQGWSEVPRGTLLFESVLVFENYPIPEAFQQQSGSASEEVQFIERTNVPLTLLFGQGTQLLTRALYECARFDGATMTRLLGHLEALLEGVAAEPNQEIRQLPLLTADERDAAPFAAQAAESLPLGDRSVVEIFEARAAGQPDSPAFVFEDRTQTYGELSCHSNRIGLFLRRIGVERETVVAVAMEPSLDVPAALLGIFKAGGVYMPLDPDHPVERLTSILRKTDAPIVLTTADKSAWFQGLVDGLRVVCLDAEEQLLTLGGEEPFSPTPLTPDQAAYILCTSGSTGRPKVVVAEHGQLLNRLAWMREEHPFAADEVCCQKTALIFIDSFWELLGPLLEGVPTVIAPRRDRREPDALVRLLAEHQVTRVWMVPSLLRTLLETEPDLDEQLRHLRFWVVTGESLTTELAQRFRDALPHAELFNLYGTTEFWDASWYPVGEDHEFLLRVPIGQPIRNMRCVILDPTLQPVPIGVPGELYVGGTGLARGYVGLAAATAKNFVPDPFRSGGARLYRTGDLARMLPDGNIECLGRIDSQVKVRGHRIELAELEVALEEQPGVKQAVVITREDQPGNVRIVAYIIQDPDYQGDPDEVGEATWGDEQIPRWQAVWDETYSREAAPAEPTFNTAGFDSSLTGLPIPAEEVRDWADSALRQVLVVEPHRVLEIGCGSGLLLFEIAPRCDTYVGTDFSEVALDYVRRQLEQFDLPSVRLMQRTADDFDGIDRQAFDAVVLHSVVQYFPGTEYLLKAIQGAIECTAPGGVIYVGDVRNLHLLESFHAWVELHRAPATMPLDEFRRLVRKRLANEKELVLDPAFFPALKRRFPRISHVRIEPKSGRVDNEFTRFRYHVMLHIDSIAPAPIDAVRVDWEKERLTFASARDRLASSSAPALTFTGIPNAAVACGLDLVNSLAEIDTARDLSEESIATVADLRARQSRAEVRGVNLRDWSAMAEELGYKAAPFWGGSGTDDRFDVLCTRTGAAGTGVLSWDAATCAPAPTRPRLWSQYANNPLQGMFAERLIPRLRAALQEKVPEHMVPSAFVLLDALPKTPSGKIDRLALPPPEMSRPRLSSVYAPPRTSTEQVLVDLWAELLGLKTVGIHDNLFVDLGGHSLLATHIISRLRGLIGVELSVRSLFDAPTIAGLAQTIDRLNGGLHSVAEDPLDTQSSGSPETTIPRLDRDSYRV